jgi:hypothetical protein
MSDLDPAAIMAEHENHWQCGYVCLGSRKYAKGDGRDWHEDRDHCLPYWLAAALAEAQEREQELRAELDEANATLDEHLSAVPYLRPRPARSDDS